MKYVIGIAAALALSGGATLPSLAVPPSCIVTTHIDDALLPAECLLPDTKTKHPTWYRDGGYCTGATTKQNVTGFSNSTNCIS